MSACDTCGTEGARLYACGRRCPAHVPGPEPGGRYCAPSRCYCGKCPSWTPVSTYVDNAERIAVDARAIASGKRRSSLREYRAAQAAVTDNRPPRPASELHSRTPVSQHRGEVA